MQAKDRHQKGKTRHANIANARSSTGPRTPAGKAHSSKNALKHGLSAAVRPVFDERLTEWGRRIASSLNDDRIEIVRLAAAVAAAQLGVLDARYARILLRDRTHSLASHLPRDPKCSILKELRIDRYERRAMSRRKRAIAALEAALAATRPVE